MGKEEQVELTHTLTHPIRFKIANALREADQPMFIGQIADHLKINSRLASFHLAALLQYGLVEGEWRVSELPKSKGKAVKYYRLTEKAKKILASCNL